MPIRKGALECEMGMAGNHVLTSGSLGLTGWPA